MSYEALKHRLPAYVAGQGIYRTNNQGLDRGNYKVRLTYGGIAARFVSRYFWGTCRRCNVIIDPLGRSVTVELGFRIIYGSAFSIP